LIELAASGDMPLYGIDWRDKRRDALRWLQELGNPYTLTGFDEDGRVGIDWGVYGAPETFLIDPNGNVVYRHTGPLSWPIWNQEFVPRIAEMPKT
jgi:cytochrome c biogenesis protein CcmG/thiol:disulfide interchange protein DsbE